MRGRARASAQDRVDLNTPFEDLSAKIRIKPRIDRADPPTAPTTESLSDEELLEQAIGNFAIVYAYAAFLSIILTLEEIRALTIRPFVKLHLPAVRRF